MELVQQAVWQLYSSFAAVFLFFQEAIPLSSRLYSFSG
jgi:hypothetical protein